MADDVYTNAVPRQPAPNINTNNKMESKGLVEINDAKKMDEDNSNTKDLLKFNSYGKMSTENDVENPSAATTINNNNNLNECPPTPFTSNTTTNKASIESYLTKTPTNTSSDDMVIDEMTTPIRPPDRSSTTKRYFQRKTPPSQQQELPSPNVPPIRPFTLGQTINMSSLASAVVDAQAQTVQTEYDHQTQVIAPSDNQSETSMDTSDVSTMILKPKSIFNPYSKQHRKEAQIQKNSIGTSNKNDTTTETLYQTIETEYNNKTNILIPVTHLPSTKDDDIQESQDSTIYELSQEDTELISKEIARQEQQQDWQEVKVKTPIRKQEIQAQQQPKYIDSNPYSVLQDDDTDNETSVINKDNKNHNDSPKEIDNTKISKAMTNKTVKQATTSTSSIKDSHQRSPVTRKTNSPGRNRYANPGRGGGARDNNTSPKSTTICSPSAPRPDTTTENMEIDDPPKIPNTASKQTTNTNQTPPLPNQDTTQNNPRKESDNGNQKQQKQTRRTNPPKHQHTYRILVKAFSNDKDTQNFTRLKILDIVLKALQKGDPVTGLVVPCDENFQTRVYTVINLESKNKREYEKIEDMLQFSSSTSIQGTIQVTTNTIFSTIKKNLECRKMLQDTHQITLYRNNINAKNLSEVGFFANHIVRHDTIESTRWITDILPSNVPEFQSELITIWGGPPKERQGAGVLKIFADRENVNVLSKILQKQFNNPHQTTFTSKEYFDTLDPKQKADYISSQYKYQKKYRSVIVKGIRNAHLPTTVIKNNMPLSITEWLKTVPDLQHRPMFLQITEVNNDNLELRCLETNLTIAKKWARNSTTHIARVLNHIQYESAFTDGNDSRILFQDIEEWNPPPPPTIQFMPDPKDVWKKDIPKTITKQDTKKQNNTKRRHQNQSQDQEYDNNTTTTVNTQSSYTQETISELQNNSYQHQQLLDTHIRKIEAIDKQLESSKRHQQTVEDHTKQIASQEATSASHTQKLLSLDRNLQEKFSSFSSNLATLEEEQQVQQRHQEQMIQDITQCAAKLPPIAETMEKQQKQLIKYFRRQNKINDQNDKELKKLRETQATHQTMITTLQAIVLQLQNSGPSTPLSQQRIRKRLKPRQPTETSIREDSDMESDDSKSDLHQMHAIAALQNHSIDQLSFIAHQTMGESDIEEELLTWDDDTTDDEESVSTSRYQSTQEQENTQDAPEHPNPGEGT
jgi:hypothetical protein